MLKETLKISYAAIVPMHTVALATWMAMCPVSGVVWSTDVCDNSDDEEDDNCDDSNDSVVMMEFLLSSSPTSSLCLIRRWSRMSCLLIL